MSKVFVDMTVSVDGYSAGPDVDEAHPLGVGGTRLHQWLLAAGASDVDRQVAAEMFSGTGAFLIGRRTFDVGIGEWGEDGAFGRPCFVVTHRPAAPVARTRTRFTFVSDGVVAALDEARAAAGSADVCVMGGAALAQACLAAGVVDELRLHLVPVLLGGGTRLFERLPAQMELERARVVESAAATHLTFHVRR